MNDVKKELRMKQEPKVFLTAQTRKLRTKKKSKEEEEKEKKCLMLILLLLGRCARKYNDILN